MNTFSNFYIFFEREFLPITFPAHQSLSPQLSNSEAASLTSVGALTSVSDGCLSTNFINQLLWHLWVEILEYISLIIFLALSKLFCWIFSKRYFILKLFAGGYKLCPDARPKKVGLFKICLLSYLEYPNIFFINILEVFWGGKGVTWKLLLFIKFCWCINSKHHGKFSHWFLFRVCFLLLIFIY